MKDILDQELAVGDDVITYSKELPWLGESQNRWMHSQASSRQVHEYLEL